MQVVRDGLFAAGHDFLHHVVWQRSQGLLSIEVDLQEKTQLMVHRFLVKRHTVLDA
jgi:hypothetical protein